MLVLSRKIGDQIQIGPDITITVVAIRGDKVRLGIEAPSDVSVDRSEVCEQIKRDGGRRRDNRLRGDHDAA